VLVTIAAFVFVLGVLIFVHELGHFIVAKAVGIGVPRFSIGFGSPTPLRFTRGETEYVIAWFPLGGYVKMASREEQDAMASMEGGSIGEEYAEFPDDKLFENKPLWARILVISAGVAMNMLFAWVVYATLAAAYGRTEDRITTLAHVDAELLPPAAQALAGIPRGAEVVLVNGDSVHSWEQMIRAIGDPASERLRFDFAGDLNAVIVPIPGTDSRARAAIASALHPMWGTEVGSVSVGGPAHDAGVEPGDVMVALDGEPVRVFYDLKEVVEASAGDTLQLTVLRGDSLLVLPVVPVEQTIQDPYTRETRELGRVGINPVQDLMRVKYGPVAALGEGARVVWSNVQLIYFTLKGIVFREVSAREIGGPILIGQMSGEVARFGLAALFEFMALLSVNLAILNLLPIPVLDGGHLVFLLIEGARGGKALSLNARMRLTQVGLVILAGIVIFVFTNDILRLFGG
jgi:regulator of sigma E protease